MIKKIVIYGERCSGTTYLENIIRLNFDVKFEKKAHFFGFENLDAQANDDILYIGIARHPVKYMNSLFRDKWHLAPHLQNNINNFLNAEFWSCQDTIPTNKSIEILEARNIYTKERYKNIFEMRDAKLRFLLEDMPKQVKNYIFIRYEDLNVDFINTVNKLKNMGLSIKKNIKYPINTDQYKFVKNKNFSLNDKSQLIEKSLILGNPNFKTKYEIQLGYIRRI